MTPSASRPLHPTALVTGANRGLGRAIAAGLKAKGVRVTLSARNEDEGRAAAAALGVAFARIDLLDPDTSFEAVTGAGEAVVFGKHPYGAIAELDGFERIRKTEHIACNHLGYGCV